MFGENKLCNRVCRIHSISIKVKIVKIDAGHGAQLSHPELIAESILKRGQILLTQRANATAQPMKTKKYDPKLILLLQALREQIDDILDGGGGDISGKPARMKCIRGPAGAAAVRSSSRKLAIIVGQTAAATLSQSKKDGLAKAIGKAFVAHLP